MPALPLTSLFAWKPPHDLAGINSSKLGGHIHLTAIIAHINKKLLTVLFWTIIVWCAQRALLKRLWHEGGLPDSAPRHSQKRSVAASLQPLPTCQMYTCFIESGPPHLKCTTLILPALPLTSLFAWKPPHDLAGINSSKLGGHSNVGVCTASTKLAPLSPGLHANKFTPAGHLAATIYCQKCHSLQSGLKLIYGLSPHFSPSVLNGVYGNGMTGVTKNTPAQTCRYIGWAGIYQMSQA